MVYHKLYITVNHKLYISFLSIRKVPLQDVWALSEQTFFGLIIVRHCKACLVQPSTVMRILTNQSAYCMYQYNSSIEER